MWLFVWIYICLAIARQALYSAFHRAGGRGAQDEPQAEGEMAYAMRQAAVQTQLANEFAKQWEGLADLIKRGRAGEYTEKEKGKGRPAGGGDQGQTGEEEESDDETRRTKWRRPNPSSERSALGRAWKAWNSLKGVLE